jgi:hypothetical protein
MGPLCVLIENKNEVIVACIIAMQKCEPSITLHSN